MLKDVTHDQASQMSLSYIFKIFFSFFFKQGHCYCFWGSFDISNIWVEAGEGVEVNTSTVIILVPLCLHEALGCSATHLVLLPLPSTTGKVHCIYQHLNIRKSVYLKAIIFSSAFLLFLCFRSSKSSWSVPVITFTFSSTWESSTNPVLLLATSYFPPFSHTTSISNEGFSFNDNLK